MIPKHELIEWLQTIEATEVAIDDGGLALVDPDRPDDVYIEVGGIPTEEDRQFIDMIFSSKEP